MRKKSTSLLILSIIIAISLHLAAGESFISRSVYAIKVLAFGKSYTNPVLTLCIREDILKHPMVFYPDDKIYHTDTGYLDISGRTKYKSLGFVVEHESGKSDWYTVDMRREDFEKRLWFRNGQGMYTVTAAGRKDRGDMYSFSIKFRVKNTHDKKLRYLAPSDNVPSNDPRVVDLAKKITDGLKDPYDKALAIHDWVALNLEYDVEALFDDARRESGASVDNVLKTGEATCAGYSRLLAAICRASGLEARIITGRASSKGSMGLHAWNEVKIYGRWVVVDATWDSGVLAEGYKFKKQFGRKYFDPDADIFVETHFSSQIEGD